MTLRELVSRTRSFRRFYENHQLSLSILEDLVDMARLTASAANLQPLRYMISVDPQMNAQIFPQLAWAAYLQDWNGPSEGERPSGYIIVLGDERHSKTAAWDMGVAAQTILLGATETGLGGCMIGSIKKKELAEILAVPEGFEILLVLAIGRPKEKIVLEQLGEDGSIKYWRDDKGVHHVPKRDLDSIILARFNGS
ncbi:Nitroreductase [Desulfonatronum thiosulfatophilum]|uniref:Nitroreductase n=1 Tax=Desulfonatronum thiosulfatophilum TaxID=617002 RepID=A0A1G6ENI7_9BACT|nr:nitroreductase family protein [Desulfonatronum thiosulfatophilum]SDB58977.1 Nitroreductase [Desulfonatronum thiosulfatophilum]